MPLHLAFLEDGELLGVLWREHEKRLKQLNFATGDNDITVPYSPQADASPDGCYAALDERLALLSHVTCNLRLFRLKRHLSPLN